MARIVKRPTQFTGFMIFSHKACGKTTRFWVGKHYYNSGHKEDGTFADPNKDTFTCEGCGKSYYVKYARPMFGKYVKEVVCNGKCTNATGDKCECSCGGVNHGANHQSSQEV